MQCHAHLMLHTYNTDAHYIYINMYVYIYYICTYVCVYVCIYTYIHIYIYLYIIISLSLYIYIYIHLYVYVYVYVYVHVCIYILTYCMCSMFITCVCDPLLPAPIARGPSTFAAAPGRAGRGRPRRAVYKSGLFRGKPIFPPKQATSISGQTHIPENRPPLYTTRKGGEGAAVRMGAGAATDRVRRRQIIISSSSSSSSSSSMFVIMIITITICMQ